MSAVVSPLVAESEGVDRYLAMERAYYADLVARSDYHGSEFVTSNSAELVVGSYAAHEAFDYERWLLGDIDVSAGATALDYGCGPGRMLLRLAPRFSRVDGADLCADVLAVARRRCSGLPSPPRLITTNGDGLPAGYARAYDFAYSVICLQHICVHAVRQRILASLFDALRPGGILAFQMGYGSGHAGMVDYYEDFVDAEGTNGVADVGVLHPSEICGDLASLGFSDIAYALTPTGPGDTHSAWIFIRARRPGSEAALSATPARWTRLGFQPWVPDPGTLAQSRERHLVHGVAARVRDALARAAALQNDLSDAQDALRAAAQERVQLEGQLHAAQAERDRLHARAAADERQLDRLRLVDLPRLRDRVDTLVREAAARGWRVAIFGAGAHTDWLARHTTLSSLPSLSVYDSDPACAGRVVLGRQVAPAADLSAAAPDVVLISSLAFQDEMATFVESLGMNGVRIVRCYT